MATDVARPAVSLDTDDSHWLRSPALTGMQTISYDTLINEASRLVVVSPHPDDEVLGCGGLIAMASDHGLDITVISVTDGERCYPGNRQWAPDQLRVVRQEELRAALNALGARDADIQALRLPDGGATDLGDRLAAAIRQRLKPGDLAVATWELDGHPDHDAVGRAAIKAATEAHCRLLRYPIWAWHWLDPRVCTFAPSIACRLSLGPELRQRKSDAIRCFRSQTGDGLAGIAEPVLPAEVLQHFLRDFEVYLS